MKTSIRMFLIAAAATCLTGAAALAQARPDGLEPLPKPEALVAVLKSDAPLDQKVDACRNLARVGDAKVVPAIAPLLLDDKLSHMVRYAIEPINDPSVDAALRDALGKTSGRIQIGIINSLGVRRDGAAVGALTKLLAGDDADVAAAAADALARIASPEAATALQSVKLPQPVAAEASLVLARRLCELKQCAKAAEIYARLQAEEQPANIRHAAFMGLLDAQKDKAPERIIEALAGECSVKRAAAAQKVACLKSEAFNKQLIAKLSTFPPAAQADLAPVLAKVAAADAAPAIAALLSSQDPAVRLAAVQALGVAGDARSVLPLCRVLGSDRPENEKSAAFTSLHGITGPKADEALVSGMTAASGSSKSKLIDLIGERKIASATDELLKQARAEERSVAVAALRALGRVAGPDRFPAMMTLLINAGDSARATEAERSTVAVARSALSGG